jgi:hypothetical protein
MNVWRSDIDEKWTIEKEKRERDAKRRVRIVQAEEGSPRSFPVL